MTEMLLLWSELHITMNMQIKTMSFLKSLSYWYKQGIYYQGFPLVRYSSFLFFIMGNVMSVLLRCQAVILYCLYHWVDWIIRSRGAPVYGP